MSATIFKHEFYSRLKSVLIWSGSVVLLILFFLSIFPSFSEQAALLNDMLSKFPPQLLTAFGLGNIDLSNLLVFFAFLTTYIQLCLAIQASNYGFGLVSVEESELTADFLLSKPVSRWQVLNSKLVAVLLNLLVTDVIIWAASIICLLAFRGSQNIDTRPLIILLASLVIFQLFFLALGLVISLLVRRVRSVTPFGLGLGLGLYVLNAFSGMLGDVKLEYITPFKHFNPTSIAVNGALDTPLVLLNVSVTILAVVISYWRYIRRDIPAVS